MQRRLTKQSNRSSMRQRPDRLRLKTVLAPENANCLACDLYRPLNNYPRGWRIDPRFEAHRKYRALQRGAENLDFLLFVDRHGGP